MRTDQSAQELMTKLGEAEDHERLAAAAASMLATSPTGPEEDSFIGRTTGPILERLEDLLAETAMYAVGDDQKSERWKPPSLQAAYEERRRSLWRKGREPLSAPLRSMGEMGIGMELYFLLMREVAKLFTLLALLHLPVMLLNAQVFSCAREDDDSAICKKYALAKRTLVFLPNMALGDGCGPAGVKSIRLGIPNPLLRLLGLSHAYTSFKPSPEALGLLLCALQLLTALLGFSFAISKYRHVTERLNEIELQHARVSQFSVLVTNLPPDVDEYELVKHFSRRYDLSKPQIAYPIYGLNVRGACLLSSLLAFSVALALFVAAAFLLYQKIHSFVHWNSLQLQHFWICLLAGAFTFAAAIGYAVYILAHRQRIGRPVSVSPLREEHRSMLAQTAPNEKRRLLRLHGTPSTDALYASTRADEATVFDHQEERDAVTTKSRVRQRRRRTCCFYWQTPDTDVEKLGPSVNSRGVIPASQLWQIKRPNPKPVRNIEHLLALPTTARRASDRYLGKWVADVSMIQSNGELIRQYMSLRTLWGEVQRARASVRRWSEAHGPAPNMHKCRKALNRLEVLVERMKDAQRELSRSVDRKGIDETTGAFVTFEHEWSAYRCVRDYEHSKYSIPRTYFQPINFRLHRSKRLPSQKNLLRNIQRQQQARIAKRRLSIDSDIEEGIDEHVVETEGLDAQTGHIIPPTILSSSAMTSIPIAVKAAPAPDDVLWENLGVPSHIKTLRRLTTLFLSVLLLALTSTVAYFKIQASHSVVRPTERLCREAVAVHVGRYDSNSTCELIEKLETKSNITCPQPDAHFLGYGGLDYGLTYDYDCTNPLIGCVRPRSKLRGPEGVSTIDRKSFHTQQRPNYLSENRNLTLCDSPCQAAGDRSQQCDALACGITEWQDRGEVCSNREHRRTRFKRRTLVDCYCDLKIRAKERKTLKFEFQLLRYAWARLRPGLRNKMKWQVVCRDFLRDRLAFKWVERTLILVIVIVNELLQFMFSILTVFERHNSVSSSLVHTSFKTFFLLFLNTAVLVPLYNLRCSNDSVWQTFGLGWVCHRVLQGNFSGFSREWYRQVGATVVQTVALSMIVNVIASLSMVGILDPIKTWLGKKHCVTQTQLNELLQPRKFNIAKRYALAFTYISATFVYCSGMPVLLVLSAVYFWVTYYADRYLVLRLYKRPPSYDAKLPLLLLKLIPIACTIHMFVATAVLANHNLIFSKILPRERSRVLSFYVHICYRFLGDGAARKLTRACVAPMFISGCSAVLYKALSVLIYIYNPELVPIPFFSIIASICKSFRNCLRSIVYCFLFTLCKLPCMICRLLCLLPQNLWRILLKSYCCRRRNISAKVLADNEDSEIPASPLTATGIFQYYWCNCLFLGAEAVIVPERSSEMKTKDTNVPGGKVKRLATWRHRKKTLMHAHLTTRPGFTEHFRCLAPQQASELLDALIKRGISSQGTDSMYIRNTPLSSAFLESSRLRKSLRQHLAQILKFCIWKRRWRSNVRVTDEPPVSAQQRLAGDLLTSKTPARLSIVGKDKAPPRTFSFSSKRVARFFSRQSDKVPEPMTPGVMRGERTPGGKLAPLQIPLPGPMYDKSPLISSARRRSSPRLGESIDSQPQQRRQSFQNAQTTRVTGILFNPKKWNEQHAAYALFAGWRKVSKSSAATSCCALDERTTTIPDGDEDVRVLPNTGIVELERIHVSGPTRGNIMRTWELIVAEKRLASYDIMANPHYRLALEFLESVGTFRPKRELVRDIGIFKERLVRLHAQIKRQQLEKALAQKVQAKRVDAVRRREIVRSCIQTIVFEVETRSLKENADRAIREARRATMVAKHWRIHAEVSATLDACCLAVCRQLELEQAAEHFALESTMSDLVSRVELLHIENESNENAAKQAASSAIEYCIARTESKHLETELNRLRKDRERVRRKLKRKEQDASQGSTIDSSSAKHRIETLEKALADSRTLVSSYEKVAKLAENSARREFDFALNTREELERRAHGQIQSLEQEVASIRNQLCHAEIQRDAAVKRETEAVAQAAVAAAVAQAAETRLQTEHTELLEAKKRATSDSSETKQTNITQNVIAEKPRVSGTADSTDHRQQKRQAQEGEDLKASHILALAEAERVAEAALLERDEAQRSRETLRQSAEEKFKTAAIQAGEAERLVSAACQEAEMAKTKQRLACKERDEAKEKARVAIAEADAAREEREAYAAATKEAERLAASAFMELKAAQRLKEAASEALDAQAELSEAELRRAAQLARHLTEAELASEAAIRDRDVARLEAARLADASLAARVSAQALAHEYECREVYFKFTSQRADTKIASLAAEAAQRAEKREFSAKKLEVELSAARAAVMAHTSELSKQRKARADAEATVTELQAALIAAENSQELQDALKAEIEAKANAASATLDATSARSDRDQANARISELSEERTQAFERNAALEKSLLVAKQALRTALTRLPKKDIDLVAAQLSDTNEFADIVFHRPVAAAASTSRDVKQQPILMHPSHLHDALHNKGNNSKKERSHNNSVFYLRRQI